MAKIQNNILFLASPARGSRPAGVTIIYPGKTRVKRWISNDWFEEVDIDTLGMKQEDPDYALDGFNWYPSRKLSINDLMNVIMVRQ